jgi:hypothetical protein
VTLQQCLVRIPFASLCNSRCCIATIACQAGNFGLSVEGFISCRHMVSYRSRVVNFYYLLENTTYCHTLRVYSLLSATFILLDTSTCYVTVHFVFIYLVHALVYTAFRHCCYFSIIQSRHLLPRSNASQPRCLYNKLKCSFSQSKHSFSNQINQLHVSATVSSHHQADPKNVTRQTMYV